MSALEQATIVFLCSLFWTHATTMQTLNKHYWKHLSVYILSVPKLQFHKRNALSLAWFKTKCNVNIEAYGSSGVLLLLLSFSVLQQKIKYTISGQNNDWGEQGGGEKKRKKPTKSLIFQINEKQ